MGSIYGIYILKSVPQRHMEIKHFSNAFQMEFQIHIFMCIIMSKYYGFLSLFL